MPTKTIKKRIVDLPDDIDVTESDLTRLPVRALISAKAWNNPSKRFYSRETYQLTINKKSHEISLQKNLLPFADNDKNNGKMHFVFSAPTTKTNFTQNVEFQAKVAVVAPHQKTEIQQQKILSIGNLETLTSSQKHILQNLITQYVIEGKANKIKRDVIYPVRYQDKTVYVKLNNSWLVPTQRTHRNFTLYSLAQSENNTCFAGSFGKVKPCAKQIHVKVSNHNVSHMNVSSDDLVIKVIKHNLKSVGTEYQAEKQFLPGMGVQPFFRPRHSKGYKAYKVMPRIKGLPLDQQTDLAFSDILQIAIEAAYQLQDIHDKGVHRDIKLDNILYHKEFELVRIIDFGLFQKKEEKYDAKTGTENYLHRELRAAIAQETELPFTTKVDNHALLVVIARLICGENLFPDHAHSLRQGGKISHDWSYNLSLLDENLQRLGCVSRDERQAIKDLLASINQGKLNQTPTLESIIGILEKLQENLQASDVNDQTPCFMF